MVNFKIFRNCLFISTFISSQQVQFDARHKKHEFIFSEEARDAKRETEREVAYL